MILQHNITVYKKQEVYNMMQNNTTYMCNVQYVQKTIAHTLGLIIQELGLHIPDLICWYFIVLGPLYKMYHISF
jgi:hypothetical protein